MELRQLEYFVAVVEEGTFTAAAERVHVSQPGVSAQVRRLEAELGSALLDRSGGRVTPTPAGESVLPLARTALRAVADIRLAVDELTGLVRGRVVVGTAPGLVAIDLPSILAGFRVAFPGIDITLTERTSSDLLDAIRAGDVDVALAGVAVAVPAGLVGRIVLDEPLVAVAGGGHAFSSRRRMRLEELAAAGPLVTLPAGAGTRAALEAACAREGVQVDIAFEASDPRMVRQIAESGLALGILPRSGESTPRLREIAVVAPTPRSRVALVRSPAGPAGPAGRALADHIDAALPHL